MNNLPDFPVVPDANTYNKIGAFRFWCQKVLPLVYDDSLSYYELLNKVVNYLNNMIADLNKMGDDVEAFTAAYAELNSYVKDYFTNLDVQEEINNKLDDMANSGALDVLLEPFVTAKLPAQVAAWLSEHITPTTPVVDNTLSVSGAAADAKVTGDELAKAIKSYTRIAPELPNSYTSANDFPINSVIAINSQITEEQLTDLPKYGELSYVITTSYAANVFSRCQIFMSSSLFAVRIRLGTEVWQDWNVSANAYNTPMYRPFNKNNYSSMAEVPENTAYVFSDVGWSDLPTGVTAGVYYSFRYAINFKTQIVFCINTGNIGVWWRVVNRNDYSIYVPWQKISSETDMQEAIRSYKYIQHGSLEGFTTANDFPVNTVIGLGSNITEEDIANLPNYGQLAYVITTSYASTATSKCQLYIGVGSFAIRVRAANTWGTWKISANKADVLKYNAYNLSSYPSMASTPMNEIRSFSASDVTWTDIPDGVNSGSFYSMQVSPAYKMQFLYSYQGTYNIWYRIIGINDPYTTLVAWHKILAPEDLDYNGMKYISSLQAYINEHNCDSLSDVNDNIVAVYNETSTFDMPDNPYNNFIFMNMRYAVNYNIQFAFTVGGKQFKYRIVDRRNGNIYTDWNAPDSFDGKVCLAMGDSICVGSRNSHYGFIGYFYLDLTKLSYVGACISNIRVTENTDTENLCIYKQFENYVNNLEHFDYYPDILIADGGINDYVYHSPLGTEPTSPVTTDAEANNLDKGTISGGLQYLFYLWIKNYPKAQKYFLLTHKTYFTSSGTYAPTHAIDIADGYNQTQMNEMIKKICNVYGVEVIDVFGKSMINTKLTQYVSPVDYDLETNTATDKANITNSYFVDSDGIHPLALGYREGYVPFVREALKTSTKKELLDDYMYYEYDGSDDENWVMGSISGATGRRFVIRDDSMPYYVDYGLTVTGTPYEQLNLIKSNQYPEATHDTPPSTGFETIGLRFAPAQRGFQLYNSNFTNLEDFIAYLNTHPLKVIIKKPVYNP